MSSDDLADLLAATGRAHHEAYAAVDGDDPEWPLWYAEHLEDPLRQRGYSGTRSELVAFLVEQDRTLQAARESRAWNEEYAAELRKVLDGS